MTKTLLILIACFCIALAAGVAVGVAVDRFAGRPHRGSRLESNLKLSKEQREQMRATWAGAIRKERETRRKEREGREKLQKEREQAVQELLTKEQKVKYQEVMQKYEKAIAALAAERRAPFDEAVENTRKILTEEQRKKYEELMKQGPALGNVTEGPGWNPRRGGPGKSGPGIKVEPPPDGE